MKTEIEIRESETKTEILINGVNIADKCSSYMVEHLPGKPPVLHLTLPASEMMLQGRLVPELPEVFKPFYEPKKIKCAGGSKK